MMSCGRPTETNSPDVGTRWYELGRPQHLPLCGHRAAHVANTFLLPSFSQFDAGFGYTFSKSLALQGNVNNLFNSIGVMAWDAPGSFPTSLDKKIA